MMREFEKHFPLLQDDEENEIRILPVEKMEAR
jgi:hypothetical protein